MITKRKLNQKLDLLLHRQALIGTVLFATSLDNKNFKKYSRQFNDLWDKFVGRRK